MTERVFVDASIFYSETLTHWLFLLKIENDSMFQLHTTEDVFAEAAWSMRKTHPPLAESVVRARIDYIKEFVDEVLEFTGAKGDLYRIHSAATYHQANFLLTNNDPRDDIISERMQHEIISPDDFFVHVTDSAPPRMLHPIIKEQITYCAKKPGHGQPHEALRRAKCPVFADIVLDHMQTMA